MDQATISKAVELFNTGLSCYRVSKLLNVNRNVLNYHLKQSGCNTTIRSKRREDPLKYYARKIVGLYHKGASLKSLAKQFECSTASIVRIVRDKSELRPRRELYQVNETYFDNIDSEHKAYFLGWMYTDGSVYGNRIRLKITDREIAEKLKLALGYTGPIYTIQPKPPNKKVQYSLAVVRQRLAEGLTRQGCMQNKTFKITFPAQSIVPLTLQPAFIRGVLEGDGCIAKDTTRNRWEVCICGTQNLLLGIKDVIEPLLGIHCCVIPNRRIFQCQIKGNSDSRKFLDYIYANSTIYLKRKYALYQELLLTG